MYYSVLQSTCKSVFSCIAFLSFYMYVKQSSRAPKMCLSHSNSRSCIILSVTKYLLTGSLRAFRLMGFCRSSLHSARVVHTCNGKDCKNGANEYAIQCAHHFEAPIKRSPERDGKTERTTNTYREDRKCFEKQINLKKYI